MAHASGLQFTLTLPGGEDVAVIDFTYREALSAPFELGVTLASRDPEIAPADTLDRNATLAVWQDGEPLRRVHGIVSEFGRGDRGHRRTFYTLVIRPALWRLGLRHNSRIFQDTPPQDILATLCDERGLTDVAFALTREPAEREFCVQYRETDLAFLQRLAAEEGLVYLHEFENAEGGAHRLVFIDATQLLPRVGERTYHGRAGGTPPRRHIRKLRQVSRVRPASAMLKYYTFKNPAYDQLHEHPAPDLGEHAQREDYEHFDYPGRYKADASGVPFTRVRLEALRAQAHTAQAESDLPELAPGMCFTLTDHDIDALNRDWQVVEVVHHGEQPQALEEDGVAQGEAAGQGQMTRYYNELVLAPADRAWRPEPPVRPRVDGPQVAFVVGPEGEEIHCDEHGRVKVQFPWDRYAEPDTAGAGGEAAERGASAWIRVSQDWAGGGYGAMAIPRIGHEVIVSFLEGDPDQPIITGRTYHAVNTPPYALPAHKTRTVLRTQSHKAEGFNELRFEDATDAEQIWLHAQKDLELLTLNDRTETIRRDSCLAIERHRLGEIHGDDHLTVHGQRHTQVKGEGGQHLTVHGSLHLEAGQAWLTESGRELHIKAGQKVVLNAGREITLKAGGSFIKLDASGVTIVGPWIKVNAGGSPGTGSGQQAEPPRLPGEAIPERSEDVTLKAHQQRTEMAGAAAAALARAPAVPPAPSTPTATVTRIAVGTAANDAAYATQRSLWARVAPFVGSTFTFVTGMLYSPALGGELERIEAPDGTVYRKYSSELVYTATGLDGATWQTREPQLDMEYRVWLANGGEGAFETWVAEGRQSEVNSTESQTWIKPKGWRLPVSRGHWQGEIGNSPWVSEISEVNEVTNGEPVPFRKGYPDFSKWSKAELEFDSLNGTAEDFSVVYEEVARVKQLDSRTAGKNYLSQRGLTPHHHEDGRTIQLIPTKLHGNIPHQGGASRLRGQSNGN